MLGLHMRMCMRMFTTAVDAPWSGRRAPDRHHASAAVVDEPSGVELGQIVS
jgi:hypothetical protein